MQEDKLPRLRLRQDIDLEKADKNCPNCKGEGIIDHKIIDHPEGTGKIGVPVICGCVTRNGGVKVDAFDKMVTDVQQQLNDGKFAEMLAHDILNLPLHNRQQAVDVLKKHSVDYGKTKQVRVALRKALQILEEKSCKTSK